MMTRWWLLTAFTLSTAGSIGWVGCGKKGDNGDKPTPDESQSSSTSSEPTAAAGKKKAATSKPRTKALDPVVVTADAKKLIANWAMAQNQGTFETYRPLYHPTFFRGVKRTSSGKVSKLDSEGWLADRARMFKKKVEVKVEKLESRSWLDAGSKLKPGVVSLRFLQRWRSGTYADHGIKVVHVWTNPKGEQRIVYEDLVNAEKGWGEVATAVAKRKLAKPKNEAEALALWKSLKITGANSDAVLASLPDGESANAMAHALLAGGNFECKEYEVVDECGEEYVEWSPLDPKATLENPCLRRRLASWSIGQLEEGEIAKHAAALEAIVAAHSPKDDLFEEILDEALGAEIGIAVPIVVAAYGGDHDKAVAEAIELVDNRRMLEALYVAGVHSAGETLAKTLEVPADLALVINIASDTKISVDVRHSLVEDISEVKDQRVDDALNAISADADCELAIMASEALAVRGDKSALPTHAKSTIQTAETDICRLAAGTSDYSGAELAKFFSKQGAEYTETTHGDDHHVDPDEDEDEDEDEVEDEPDYLDQEDFLALNPFDDEEVSISFGQDKSSKVFVSAVDREIWVGCGC